jgi:hypothetical protein
MMLKIMIPTEAGNLTIKDGSLPKVIEAAMRGGLGVEDYCWKLIRAVVDSEPTPD